MRAVVPVLALLVAGCFTHDAFLGGVSWTAEVDAPFDGAAAEAALRALGWPSADGYPDSVEAHEGAWAVLGGPLRRAPISDGPEGTWPLVLELHVPLERSPRGEDIATEGARLCDAHGSVAATFFRAFEDATAWPVGAPACEAQVVVE